MHGGAWGLAVSLGVARLDSLRILYTIYNYYILYTIYYMLYAIAICYSYMLYAIAIC